MEHEPSSQILRQNSVVNLSAFLKTHQADTGEQTTHTKIPGKNANNVTIHGGKWNIPESDMRQFYALYLEELKMGNAQYFTEKQFDVGPILVDIDMRFPIETTERIYTQQHILELKYIYLNCLKEMFDFAKQSPFHVFIFQKHHVNVVPEKHYTKDGIHMIIGIHCPRSDQIELRRRVLIELEKNELWCQLPLLNQRFDDVVDKTIATGSTGWQLFGSQKPNHEPYQCTFAYKVAMDDADGEFVIDSIKPPVVNVDTLFLLSARNTKHPHYLYLRKYEPSSSSSGMKKPASSSLSSSSSSGGPLSLNTMMDKLLSVKNEDEFNEILEFFLEKINVLNFEWKEIYDYVMILPESYYGSGSYSKWTGVGMALRNIHNDLFIVWVALSRKWRDFNFNQIGDLFKHWMSFHLENAQGKTRRSIMHWAKVDNFEEYTKIRQNTVEYYINDSLKNPKSSDHDIAKILYHFFKDQYICVSIGGDIWYHFQNHRWKKDEKGTSLRKKISSELASIYMKMIEEKKKLMITLSDEEKEKIIPVTKKLQEVILRLGSAPDKDRIMKEAKELFYDSDQKFMNDLDTNLYLLAFNNGVFDFKARQFRDGRPEDYISITTDLDFVPLDERNPSESVRIIIEEIHDFMCKLFPIDELRNYMWEHLASVLIGNAKQLFHMYIGMGSNGKSVLMDLMTLVLGDYKGDIPISVLTSPRVNTGGTHTELVALKSARFVVCQEPSECEKINEGPMKQLTSGKDPISCRAPYMPTMLTYTPQFSLVMCANVFMEIKSQDYGTWRRIRVVKFMAKFDDNPVDDDPCCPFQFKKEEMSDKFIVWKEIFMAMLVNRAVVNQGIVKECSMVMEASNRYKNEQDSIGTFIIDNVVREKNGKITQNQLKMEFERWYKSMFGDFGCPKPKNVYDYFDKKYPTRTKQIVYWKGISIVRHDTEDADDSDDDEPDFMEMIGGTEK
jgi:P4 family phage/plasmid primase-like protien